MTSRKPDAPSGNTDMSDPLDAAAMAETDWEAVFRLQANQERSCGRHFYADMFDNAAVALSALARALLAERKARVDAAQEEAKSIIACICSTTWSGYMEIVEMIQRRIASRSRPSDDRRD